MNNNKRMIFKTYIFSKKQMYVYRKHINITDSIFKILFLYSNIAAKINKRQKKLTPLRAKSFSDKS